MGCHLPAVHRKQRPAANQAWVGVLAQPSWEAAVVAGVLLCLQCTKRYSHRVYTR